MLARDLGPLALSRETPRTRLSFTQGRWRYREWGVPVVDVASSGVSVTVDVATANGTAAAGTSETVWKRIVAHLAGVFCASLHELDASRVVEPRQTFREKAHGSDAHSGEDNGMRPNDSGSTLFGTLPRETVCTENLTPWMKLLPCNGRVCTWLA